MPAMAAAIAATPARRRCTNTSSASRAGSSPSLAREMTSRMSLVPARPSSPERCSSAVGHLVDADLSVLEQPQEQAGIDAAGAGRHHQPLQRGEAHRGVDRAPARHRGQRGAGPEVAAHDAEVVPARELGGAARRVGVREAVEAVPAQRPALAPLRRQRVGGGRGRERGVEAGVEAGGGRQRAGGGVDGGERPRLVQRGQRRELLEPRAHARVYPRRRAEVIAAVHDAMGDRVDLREAGQCAGRERGAPAATRCRAARARRRRRRARAA